VTLQVRPAQLKDLGAIEALYRQQVREAERSPLKRQFASTRLWFLLNSAFASIIPITSAADHVYVMEDAKRRTIEGFVQAETAALGPGVWQILNLCLSPDLDRVQDGRRRAHPHRVGDVKIAAPDVDHDGMYSCRGPPLNCAVRHGTISLGQAAIRCQRPAAQFIPGPGSPAPSPRAFT